MTALLQGRRVPDGIKWYGEGPESAQAGDYGRVLMDGRWVWRCRTPNGYRGHLGNHEVTEHEDGTITVSPSILIRTTINGQPVEVWHGFLERGVWRAV